MTTDQIVTLLVAVLSGGFLGSAVQGFLQRRKLGADYADVIARSATGLLKPLAERVEELQTQLLEERRKVRLLSVELDNARTAVRLLRSELQATRDENKPQGGGG